MSTLAATLFRAMNAIGPARPLVTIGWSAPPASRAINRSFYQSEECSS